ncbi:RNA polymerase sigma factor [Candidatus Poribacteria bacterium]|nr:RNA polymerase sigma factor [Candidatus Poribacteria bacterium]
MSDWSKYSDVELVIASLLGNLDAFGELITRYRPAMIEVAREILRDEIAAEDVVQDACILAFKALPQLERFDRFGSWLYSITRNRAIRYRKRSERMEPRSDIDLIVLKRCPPITETPARILERRERYRELNETIEGLPSEYRLVIRMHYWDEMPLERIADFLSVPVSTVKWRLFKARQLLRSKLIKRGFRDER